MLVELMTYQQQLQAKLAELQGFVENNLVKAAQAQNSHIKETQFGFSFQQHAGKLSPLWEGSWFIQEVKIDVTMKIMNGQVTHVNRLQHKIH